MQGVLFEFYRNRFSVDEFFRQPLSLFAYVQNRNTIHYIAPRRRLRWVSVCYLGHHQNRYECLKIATTIQQQA